MFAQLFKLRVAVLWVSIAVSMAGAWLLGLITPGTLDEMIEGRIDDMAMSDGLAFMMSTYFIIPLLMAGLTLVVSDRLSGYGNLVIGTLIGLFLILGVAAEAVAIGFDAHLLILEDRVIIEKAEEEITVNRKNAGYAFDDTILDVLDKLSSVQDEYLKDRIADVRDVATSPLKDLVPVWIKHSSSPCPVFIRSVFCRFTLHPCVDREFIDP